MFNPKVTVTAAAIGFVLSTGIGFFSGASFTTVVFRALFSAMLLSALVTAVRFVALRVLPELLEDSTVQSVDTSAETGNLVDISVGDENSSTDDLEDFSDTMPDFFQAPVYSRTEDSPEITRPDEIPLTSPAAAPASATKRPEQNNKPSSVPEHRKAAGGLDILPDMEDFIPDVVQQDDDSDTPGPGGEWSEEVKNAVHSPTPLAGETETMAKAIRTILSRDS